MLDAGTIWSDGLLVPWAVANHLQSFWSPNVRWFFIWGQGNKAIAAMGDVMEYGNCQAALTQKLMS